MNGDVEGALRLAWQAHRDGQPGRRDALLTLALASENTVDEDWVERCHQRLITWRPDHRFAGFGSLKQALEHPQVEAAIAGLRQTYSSGRIKFLLLRTAVRRGPFRRVEPPLSLLLEDMFGPTSLPRGLRADAPSALPSPALNTVRAGVTVRAKVTHSDRAKSAQLPDKVHRLQDDSPMMIASLLLIGMRLFLVGGVGIAAKEGVD
jgi:hypothetical protein